MTTSRSTPRKPRPRASVEPYREKLRRMEGETLVAVLAPEASSFVRRLAETYRLTLQELRMVAQAARDLEMWREESLAEWWGRAEAKADEKGRERKKALLRRLDQHLTNLARAEKEYSLPPLAGPPRRQVRLVERDAPRAIFGRCPAYSEKTVCCRLHTIDAVVGCAFGCSYCTIQTFYGDRAELRADLADRLREIELDRDRFYHIGTGQASDSLVWGNRGGNLDALFDFAARHPNVLLELKTKSDNIRYLLERRPPANVVCSWSLNTEAVIRNEEHGTASLERRLGAARTVADRGVRVAFHFHPMVSYRDWRNDYGDLARRLLAEFSAPEVAFVSMGSLTFIRPVVKEIRRRGGETKILQMPMVADPHGKQTYPADLKVELYGHLYETLRPWHESVFFYLCMETPSIWETVFGRFYASNEDFEEDFARRAAGRGAVATTAQ